MIFPSDSVDLGAIQGFLPLGISSVRLITNNPQKVDALRTMGVSVRAQCALVTGNDPRAAHYLETKRLRMRHALPPIEDLLSASISDNGDSPRDQTSW